jgi:flagellar biosynthesis protein FlhG
MDPPMIGLALTAAMDEFTRPRFDPSSALTSRARALRRVTMLKTGRWHLPLGTRQGARFIAVTGSPGVGKSTIAANLAIALAGLRARVVLIDLDLRRPTLHRLFGIDAPVSGLRALLEAQVETMEQALTPTAVRNLFLVSAEGARPPALPAQPEQQHRLLEQVWELDADVVIADVPAAAEDELVDLFALGALRVVVASPDSRSVRSAYSYFRSEVIRELDHVAGTTPEVAALVGELLQSTPRAMGPLLAALDGKPDLRAAIRQALDSFGGRLIGNRIHGPTQADLLHAASRLLGDYLGITVPLLGTMAASEHIGSGGSAPLLLGSGVDRNVRALHAMAELLMSDINEFEAPHCVPGARPAVSQRCCLPGRPAADETGEEPPLPVPLGTYMRRFPRYPVDWHARYVSDAGRDLDVRVVDVSEGGASIEVIPNFDLGERGFLTFTQLPGQPQLSVTVVDARRPMGRAGLRFEGPRAAAQGVAVLARAAAQRVATPPHA